MRKLFVCTATLAICVCFRIAVAHSAVAGPFSVLGGSRAARSANGVVLAADSSSQPKSARALDSSVKDQSSSLGGTNPAVAGCGQNQADCPPKQCKGKDSDDKGAAECRKHQSHPEGD